MCMVRPGTSTLRVPRPRLPGRPSQPVLAGRRRSQAARPVGYAIGSWRERGSEASRARSPCLMARRALPLSGDEFVERVQMAARPTPDDVSITRDGRRLDSEEAVLAWLSEVEAERPPATSSNSMKGETSALDIDRLLTALDRHKVDFLLVRGVAAIAHGARPTADLDCLAGRSRENTAISPVRCGTSRPASRRGRR